MVLSGQEVYTPENAALVKQIHTTLKEIFTSKYSSELNHVYSFIKPKIDETILLAEQLQESNYPQTEVANLFHKFSRVIEFPVNYLSRLSIEGDSFIFDFTVEEYLRRTQSVNKNHKNTADDYLAKYAGAYMGWAEEQHPLLDEKFELTDLGGTTRSEFEASHFFQYKYVYRLGEIPMIDFVATRETGLVFIGVRLGIRGDYDGRSGTSLDFSKHDYRHARTQKVKDQQLFDLLEIKNLEDAKKLKEQNQKEVMALLDDWKSLSDQKLKAAIEVVLFGLMHEQSLSYPTQVFELLKNKEDSSDFKRGLLAVLKRGRFGQRIPKILGREKTEKINEAFNWIKNRKPVL